MTQKRFLFCMAIASCVTLVTLLFCCMTNGFSDFDRKHWMSNIGFSQSVKSVDSPDVPGNSDEPIAPHEHVEVAIPAVSATCTNPGLTAGTRCEVCDEIITAQDEIPATGHTAINEPAVTANCTDDGLTAGIKCEVCDEVFIEQKVIKATGHNITYGTYTEPTCLEVGYRSNGSCTVCGIKVQDITTTSALGHDEVIDSGTPSTCTVSGMTGGSHCSRCETVLTYPQPISLFPHNYVYGKCTVCDTENLNPKFDPEAYYLVGTMNDWKWTSDKYKFEEVGKQGSGSSSVVRQYKLVIQLTAGTQVKIYNGALNVYYSNYESGYYILWEGNSPYVRETREYSFYLKFYTDGSVSIYCGSD